jgi:hypothetical protein
MIATCNKLLTKFYLEICAIGYREGGDGEWGMGDGGWGMKKVFRSPFSVFRSSEDGLGVRKLVASLKPET